MVAGNLDWDDMWHFSPDPHPLVSGFEDQLGQRGKNIYKIYKSHTQKKKKLFYFLKFQHAEFEFQVERAMQRMKKWSGEAEKSIMMT